MKKLFVMMTVLALAAVVVLPAVVAGAAPPQFEVSGTCTLTDTGFLPSRTVGGEDVMFAQVMHHLVYDGTVVGTADETLNMVANLKGLPDKVLVNSQGLQEFSGTVLGMSGTFTALVHHHSLDGFYYEVEQTILSGTGELADLRGTLHFTVSGVGPWVGEYSGRLHFVP